MGHLNLHSRGQKQRRGRIGRRVRVYKFQGTMDIVWVGGGENTET